MAADLPSKRKSVLPSRRGLWYRIRRWVMWNWFDGATLRPWSSRKEIFTTCPRLELSLVGESVEVSVKGRQSHRVPHCEHIWCCEENVGQPLIRSCSHTTLLQRQT